MNQNPILVTKLLSWVASLLVGWLINLLPFTPDTAVVESLTFVATMTLGGLVGNLIARAKVTPWWKVAEGYWTRQRIAVANTPKRGSQAEL